MKSKDECRGTPLKLFDLRISTLSLSTLICFHSSWPDKKKTAKDILDSYTTKGVVNEMFMIKCIEPLLTAKNLSINITLMELYNINKIEIHLYSTNLNSCRLEKIDISYKTHPDLSVLKALSMSTSYPFVFQPVLEEDKCYVDGGILNNLPLNDCIKQTNCNKDEILVIKNYWIRNNNILTKDSTIFDYL